MHNGIKLIIFDLDGVLLESKRIHFYALNKALGEKYSISWEDHLNKYDGLKTKSKFEILTKEKGLPVESYDEIWKLKQEYTHDALNGLKPSEELIECFRTLSKHYKIGCGSNSIRKTIVTSLNMLGIIEFFDVIVSNEDVVSGKPHPEIYWKCMSSLRVNPEETLIIEDSPHGLLSAYRSNANVMRVKDPNDVNLNNIMQTINHLNSKKQNIPKWSDKTLNVLIPMAGAGSRFESAGYTFPKPLIDVNGKPMIQVVVDNLNIEANYIFVVRKEHRVKYNLDTLLNLIAPNCKIVEVDGMTEGAACTTLLAKELINSEAPLLMANSDQFVEWNSNEFMYKMNETKCDAGIVTFTATHPKWSFARLNENGDVIEVQEKNPISDIATVGIYFWKHGSNYVKYAEQMIRKNIRVNNEFYVCPVFNEAIADGLKIKPFFVENMHGLGTPEDLNAFLLKQ